MKIAYLTTCFGTQSHTFMRREISALRDLGAVLNLYGIRQDKQFQAPDALNLVNETHYLYPLNIWATLTSNLRLLARSPIHYFAGLFSTLRAPEFSWRRKFKLCAHYMLAAPVAQDMKHHGITHIHAQFLNVSASIAMFAAHHNSIPFSITVHSAGSYGAKDTLGLPQKLNRAQFLVMISKYNVSHYHQVSPCEHKSYVIRCGMDIDRFPFKTPADKYQLNRDYSAHPLQLLAVARFVPKKGLTYLLDAISELAKRGVNAHLTLVGSGPLEETLKNQTLELSLQSQVTFTGPLSSPHVIEHMTKADIVVVPSITTKTGDMEGLPVVIMEAMACGTYVIASNHAGIPEIVIDGITGSLIEPNDATRIGDAIVAFLSCTSVISRVTMARQKVEQEFNITSVAQQRLDLFHHFHSVA